ncbi:MAG: spherulation-specific family 4 protein [Streptosporangiaceae bacterium]
MTPTENDGTPQAPPPPRLVVPAYIHPAVHPGDWEWLGEHAERVRLVILNIHNGPGSGPEAPFKEVAERLRAAGIPVIGYLDTNYGNRPAAQIMAELGCYLDWYEVSGVCLDRVSAAVADVPYYGALSARIRKEGAGVVFFNHGAYPDEAYARHADLLGTFEGPWPAYRRLTVPRWTATWPAEKFYHVVYSVPPERFGEAAQLAVQRRAASVYITERGGANPYDRLPIDSRK